MADKPNQRAIWEGSFTIYGVKLRCYVLDTGHRMIRKEDLDALLEKLADDHTALPDSRVVGDLDAFHRWVHGKGVPPADDPATNGRPTS